MIALQCCLVICHAGQEAKSNLVADVFNGCVRKSEVFEQFPRSAANVIRVGSNDPVEDSVNAITQMTRAAGVKCNDERGTCAFLKIKSPMPRLCSTLNGRCSNGYRNKMTVEDAPGLHEWGFSFCLVKVMDQSPYENMSSSLNTVAMTVQRLPLEFRSEELFWHAARGVFFVGCVAKRLATNSLTAHSKRD